MYLTASRPKVGSKYQARIEVPVKDLARLNEEERWQRIEENVKRCGYHEVVADPRGYFSGRLNQPTEKIF